MPIIRAAVTHAANAPFVMQDVALDDPRGDEILVRIEGVGICHTDLVAQAGYFTAELPAVFGHEAPGSFRPLAWMCAKCGWGIGLR